MKVLYIDTTSNYLYSALADNGKITGEIKLKLEKDLSVFALKRISELITSCNLTPEDIDKIMIVNGPGSFTGIRIGVTIAKTYAWGLKKDIITISSLEAMSLSTALEVPYRVPVIDARRNYVYAAIYDKDNNPILKEQYLSIDALKCVLDKLPDDYTIITNNDLELDSLESYTPNFSLIINKYENRKSVNPHSVNPIYLKLTEAEENLGIEII